MKCRFNMTQLKSTHMCLVNDKQKFPQKFNKYNYILFCVSCQLDSFFLPTTIFFFTQTSICQTDKLCAKQKRLVFQLVLKAILSFHGSYHPYFSFVYYPPCGLRPIKTCTGNQVDYVAKFLHHS